MRRVASSVLFAGLVWVGAMGSPRSAAAQWVSDGSFVRVTERGGVSPFRMVAYDVTVRGDTVLVSLIQEALCTVGQRQTVKVLQREAAQSLLKRLKDLGAFETAPVEGAVLGPAEPDPPGPRGRPGPLRYEFWSALGREMRRFHVDQQVLVRDPGLLRTFVSVRDAVLSQTGRMPMRDLYHPADQMGTLCVTASRGGTAVLDGFEAFRLPMDGVEVVEGEHTLKVTADSGEVREVRVRVVRGLTARYHIVFDDQEPR